jgi:hypothetical protein
MPDFFFNLDEDSGDKCKHPVIGTL